METIIGQRYKVKEKYSYTAMRGLVGTLVKFYGDPTRDLGLDFMENFPGLTHSLDGFLKTNTGRYFGRKDVESVEQEWDD